MALTRKKAPVQPGREREALRESLRESPGVFASACGMCGSSVPADDPSAHQTYYDPPRWPFQPRERSWRYHEGCLGSPAAVLARVLGEPVDRVHAAVARRTPVPLYRDLPRTGPEDRGKPEPWAHLTSRERRELREAVAVRRAEQVRANVPAPHPDGWPCAVCGVSHEVPAGWGEYQGRPACAACARLVAVTKIPGNLPLKQAARSAAWGAIPAGRVVDPFPLACEMGSYGRLAEGERRQPWGYMVDLPVVPPTAEQRLAELEAKLETVA